ncbi:partial Sensor protein FixL, partial [Anaerolineae bacterium]
MSNDATHEIRRLNAQLEERVAQLTAALEMKARELRDSEERFRYAMEVSHEGFWDWNIKTGAFYCNPGLAERLDYDPAELSQYTAGMWQDLLPPDEREAVVASIERDLRDFGHFEIEFKLRLKHGAYRWILSRGKVVERDADGAPLRAIGTHSDIEESKQADTLNRRLASIIESSSDLIATATPAGRVDYMNQAGRALLGIGAAEPLEQTRIEDCHPAWAYQRVAQEGIPAALAQGRWLDDTAMLRRDGSELPVSQLIISQR